MPRWLLKCVSFSPSAKFRLTPSPSQVQQSFATSLEHLGTSYVDSLIMHSPMRTKQANLTVWKELEALVTKGKVRRAFARQSSTLADLSLSLPHRYANLVSPTSTTPTSFAGHLRPSRSSPRSCELLPPRRLFAR